MDRLLILTITVCCATVLAVPVTDWHPSNLVLCHEERKDRAREMRYDAETYRAADRVAPRIWVGSVCAAMDTDFLKKNKISFVLSMASEWPYADVRNDIFYDHFPPEGQGLGDSIHEDAHRVRDIFSNASARVRLFLERNPDREVLIYCNMGVSRSASVAALVIMQEEKRSFQNVLSSMKSARPIVTPNALYGYVLQHMIGEDYDRKSDF